MYISSGRARLLVAVFEHLEQYRERAEAKNTDLVDELIHGVKNIDAYTLLLYDAIKCLDNREYDIIERLYAFPPRTVGLTRDEVARNFNVTRERICQVEAKALQKIKRYLTKLNDEETPAVISALKIKKTKQLEHAKRAEEQGDHVSMDVYTHNYQVLDNAISKLKIQQDIHKWEEGTR